MMTSSTLKGGTLALPRSRVPGCAGIKLPRSGRRPSSWRPGAALAVAQALNERPGFFPTRQQAGGAHLVQGGRGGRRVGDQQLVLAGPVDRQRRVGGGDGVLALRAV